VSWPFSRRLDWALVENRLARAEAAARQRPGFVDLTVSNPTLPELGFPDVSAALGQVLARHPAGFYGPAPSGTPAAREAVAAVHRAAGHAMEADRIVLTASSSESYALLFKLLGDPGDAVLVPAPSYPLFDYLVRLEGLTPIPYRSSYQPPGHWCMDTDTLDDAAARAGRDGRRVAAIVTVNPNNPTGAALDDAEAAALEQRCAIHRAALIADEVFSDFVRRPPPAHVACLAARATRVPTFSLGGLSKSCGLPQLKVGWIALGGPAALRTETLARLELVADTYLSVNGPAQGALPELLHLGAAIRGAIQDRLCENEARLQQTFDAGSAVTVLRAHGGWSAILRLPATRSDEEWALALLEEELVLAQPGFFFELDGGAFLVVSLLPAPRSFAAAVARLRALVARCG
jgi:alanine-synthesizing transaminase